LVTDVVAVVLEDDGERGGKSGGVFDRGIHAGGFLFAIVVGDDAEQAGDGALVVQWPHGGGRVEGFGEFHQYQPLRREWARAVQGSP
jgi:hypothetical protein